MNTGDTNTPISNHGDRNELPETVAYTGHHVIDERGERIGQITDVIYDGENPDVIGDPLIGDPVVSATPTWLVVDPGLLRASHYVPVTGSYRSVDGDIVVPWDKEWIKSAPTAHGDHILSALDMQHLVQHYATV